MAPRLKQAEFTISQTAWVALIVGGFLSWLFIITIVTLFAAYASSTEPEKPKVCRSEFGHRIECTE